MPEIKTSQVEKFIRRELPGRIQKDFREIRMVRESDLEACVYFALRSVLRRDKNWKVFTRKHTKTTGHYVDLLLFKRHTPRIAIELKWNQKRIGTKDYHSLKTAIRKLNVNRAYFISTVVNGSQSLRSKPWKESVLKNNALAIFIPQGRKDSMKSWHAERRVFTRMMAKGIARHKSAP